MIRKSGFKAVLIVTFLAASFLWLLFPNSAGYAADVCKGIGPKTAIWWDGAELKVGQIGRLQVLKDTPLYKLERESQKISRTLKAGENYRIYAFKQGKLGVGSGYYVDRDSRIIYETPSKTKLAQLACKKQAIENSKLSIQIGETKASVENKLGKEKRVSLGEYGINWYTYHNHYDQFYMIGYVNNRVDFVYSNYQNYQTNGIYIGSSKQEVRTALGSPIIGILKGNINYVVDNTQEQQTFRKNGLYITVFYDVHMKGNVTALQVITSNLENKKQGHFGSPSASLQQAFEMQMFDLTNAERVKHGLAPLSWDERARRSARKHSLDMATNNFFDHVNLKGQDPFERMEAQGIRFWTAGENIAMGYPSSIFAHEALMNSLGHRKNILKPDYTHVGMGVQFQTGTKVPYYTQNYFKPY
ncbi:SCP-like extracellular [Bacillus methanolicus PB1]|uniref:SCP-like extracellular n=1 Tax=Bacillus methanolicus PB1 TaxID=997296 RepID=I3E1V5_BACMT|nr:CAP-associated domain-containing protein [Bacillus methanolicus]EIJ80476.1 SCP-like extracellular [Bacillus methanolicus PB1]